MTKLAPPSLRPAYGHLLFLVGGTLVALTFLGLFFAWPTATLVALGFTQDGHLDFSGFWEVLRTPRTWSVAAQTVWMVACGTVGSLVLGVPGAFLLYCTQFPGRVLVRALVSVPFVLPTVAVSIGFRWLFAESGWLGFLGLEGSMSAVVLAMIFFNISLVVRSVGTVWAKLDSRQSQAAAMLGARPGRVFRTVTLPALGPALISAGALVFLYCATAYSIVLILGDLGTATLETEIYRETAIYGNLRVASVLSIMQLLVVVAALVFAGKAQKRLQTTLKLDALPTQRPLRRQDLPLAGVFAVAVLVLIVLPLSAVVVRSLRRGGHWTFANYTDLVKPKVSPAVRGSVLDALGNSLFTAALAGVIALIVGLCVAIVVSRRARTRTARTALAVLDAAFMLPLGVSAVTVGFGFLVTLNGPPLNLANTGLIIPLAQAVVAVPLVVRLVLPVLQAIDPKQSQAAAMLGATPWRAMVTVEGPYLVRSGAVALGFAVAISLGEFGATSFLARPETATLPVVIYRLVSRPGAVEQGLAMSSSVLLCVVTAAIMVGLELATSAERNRR